MTGSLVHLLQCCVSILSWPQHGTYTILDLSNYTCRFVRTVNWFHHEHPSIKTHPHAKFGKDRTRNMEMYCYQTNRPTISTLYIILSLLSVQVLLVPIETSINYDDTHMTYVPNLVMIGQKMASLEPFKSSALRASREHTRKLIWPWPSVFQNMRTRQIW